MLNILCCQDGKSEIDGPAIQMVEGKNDDKKLPIVLQPNVGGIAGTLMAGANVAEPDWVGRFFRALPPEGPPEDDDRSQYGNEEEETDSKLDDESSRDNEDGEPSPLPFQGIEFSYPGQDYSEIIQPRQVLQSDDEKDKDFEVDESRYGDRDSKPFACPLKETDSEYPGKDHSENSQPRRSRGKKKEDGLINKDDPGGSVGGQIGIDGREVWQPSKDNKGMTRVEDDGNVDSYENAPVIMENKNDGQEDTPINSN